KALRRLDRVGRFDLLQRPGRLLPRSGRYALVLVRVPRGDDDVPADDLDVLVAEVSQRRETRVVRVGELAVVLVRLDVVGNVGDGGEVLEEAPVRTGHVAAHVLDEIVSCGRRSTGLLA